MQKDEDTETKFHESLSIDKDVETGKIEKSDAMNIVHHQLKEDNDGDVQDEKDLRAKLSSMRKNENVNIVRETQLDICCICKDNDF